MQVSLNWLRRYVDLPEDPKDIAASLTSLGFEVEAMQVAGEGVTGVVVGEVRAREKHPEADKLSVCRVYDGQQEWQVVCGAPNVAAGQKVLFAQVGANLPGGLHIKKAKLRGVESFGMICAEDEVGLGQGHDGILVLPADTAVGLGLQAIPDLCDAHFEVNVTPNRPDALSHVGLARELAAKYGRPLREPLEKVAESGTPTGEAARLQVEDGEACPRYVGRVIEGIAVGESPAWLQAALRSVGKNPINNVVDLTNFVLLEWGQPSHAFDLDTLAGQEVVVRRARSGETLTTLDGANRTLSTQDLVIADAEKAQVLAGVMGGVNSGVTAQTRRVFLEVAYFQPAFVRLQARRHGLSSDSSYRFERGIDYLRTEAIADHLAALIAKVCGGNVRRGRVEFLAANHPRERAVVALRPDRVRRLLGVEIQDAEIGKYLSGIGLEPTASKVAGALAFRIPGFRGDLTREADLIEEVARLMDYNTIPGKLPSFPLGSGGVTPREALARQIRHTLRDLGLQEALSLRFTSRKQLAKLGLAENDSRLSPVLLKNPLSEDWEAMPTTGLPNLLQALCHNQNNQQNDAALFEVGKAFFVRAKSDVRDNGIREEALLTLAVMGEWPNSAWNGDHAGIDFYALKGLLENLLRKLGRPLQLAPMAEVGFLHPKESGRLIAQGGDGKVVELGVFGMLHPRVQQAFDLRHKVAVAEIHLDSLLAFAPAAKRFQAFSTQVASVRDFNALIPEAMSHGELLAGLPKQALLESLRLRSIYRGQGVPEGYKAMHYELIYRHGERSLTDEEVQTAHENVKSALGKDERIRFK